jgi:tetratricopeptide (TPR) repeat protein
VRFVDGAASLASQSSNGITGARFFHEHVHLTFEGNYQLARALMQEVVPALPRSVRQSAFASFPTMQECAQRLAWTDFNRLEVDEEMRARLQRPPFATQLGHEQRDRVLQSRIEAMERSLTTAAQERIVAEYRLAVARSPGDWVLRENLARLLEASGRASEAVVQWNEVVRLLPHDAQAYYQIGNLLTADSQPAKAIRFFREASRRDPTLVDARHGLALAFADLGRLADAERELHAALRMQPGFVEARVNLGKLLLRQGKADAAAQEFERVLRRDTNNLHAHLHLGGLLAQRGNVAQATTHYKAALRIDSENVTAREGLKKLQSP